MVVLSSPHNPTGILASRESLDALARVAQGAALHVLVDEVYLDAALGEKHPPAATLSPSFISSNSLTKSWGLASLRCGWTLASPEVTERIRRARDIVDVWGPIPSDRLAVLAFQNLDRLAARARALVETNSRLATDFIAARRDLECIPSHATLAFPRFADGREAGPFTRRLLERYGTAVSPGSFFGSPAHFRLSLGGSTEKLRQGLDSMARCLDSL
jgi:hypothetical protein